jgi:hypothetical protein
MIGAYVVVLLGVAGYGLHLARERQKLLRALAPGENEIAVDKRRAAEV